MIAVLGAALGNFYGEAMREKVRHPMSTDFYKLYLSGDALIRGQGMYWSVPARMSPGDPCYHGGRSERVISVSRSDDGSALYRPACLHPNLNPPLFAVIALPLAWLDYHIAYWVWSLCALFCAVVSMWLLVRAFTPRTRDVPLNAAIAVVSLFAYFPTFISVTYGQVTMLILLLTMLGWNALREERDVRGGVWLGLAASLKPFMGLFLLALLFAGNRRASAGFVLAGLSSAWVGWLVAGPSAYGDYLRIAADVTWLAASWNASFGGYFSRLFGGSENVPWIDLPMVGRVLVVMCSLAVLSLLVWLLKRVKPLNRNAQIDVIFAMTLPAMLLLSPLGWLYYFPLLGLSVLMVWRMSANLLDGRLYKAGLIAVVMPTVAPQYLQQAHDMNGFYDWFWVGGVYCYILVALLVMVMRLVVRQGVD